MNERKFLSDLPFDNLPTNLPAAVVQPRPLFTRVRTSTWRLACKMPAEVNSNLAEEVLRGTPFLWAPVWLGFGSILYFTSSFEPNATPLVALALCLLAIRSYLLARGHSAFVTSMILLICLGACFAKFQTWRLSTPMLAGEITTHVKARVISISPVGNGQRAVLDVIGTERPELKYAPSRVRVSLRQLETPLFSGDFISVRLRLSPPSGPVRPNGYDFAFQSFFDGIGANGFSIGPITKLESRSLTLVESTTTALERLRQTIATRIRAVIKGNDGEVAVALIAGVQAGIDERTNESLRASGLAHILSISGLHMALVAGLFLVVIRSGFAFFPQWASRFPAKKYAAAIALFASLLYLFLSGGEVATLRSFIMLAIMLIAVLLDRPALTLRNLSLAAIAILVITPHEIMGPSFQMSFAATMALISAYAFWAQRGQGTTKYNIAKPNIASSKFAKSGIWFWCAKFSNALLALSLTSIIAGFATALFSAWHFHRLAPMGLPANLAASLPVSVMVMPGAILSALALPFGLEEWPLRFMGHGVKMMILVSDYFAAFAPAGSSGALSKPVFITLSAALIAICLLQTRLRWLALLPLPIALYMMSDPVRPDLYILEDAKLVALALGEKQLAVNRARPNLFSMKIWQMASAAPVSFAPAKTAAEQKTGQFFCQETLCTAVTENGVRIAWLGYPEVERPKNTPAKLLEQAGQTDQNSSCNASNATQNNGAAMIAMRQNNTRNALDTPLPVGSQDVLDTALPSTTTKTAQSGLSQPPIKTLETITDNPKLEGPPFTDRAATEAVLNAKYQATLANLCNDYDIVILAGPDPDNSCFDRNNTLLFTAKQLAIKGSVEVYFTNKNSILNRVFQQNHGVVGISKDEGFTHTSLPDATEKPSSKLSRATNMTTATAVFAIENANRPWNFERKFSRAARNMPPFQPISQPKALAPAQ